MYAWLRMRRLSLRADRVVLVGGFEGDQMICVTEKMQLGDNEYENIRKPCNTQYPHSNVDMI